MRTNRVLYWLLRYQKALNGAIPTVEASKIFLAHLREQGYSPSTLRVHRAALQGFHAWRGENLVFPIKMPRHLSLYIEAGIVARMLDLARETPKDYLILRLMSDAGLRRQEVVDLKVKNVNERALRFRGKGDRDRTVPLTKELAEALKPFGSDKGPDDRVVGVGEGVIYRVVKKSHSPEQVIHKLREAEILLNQGTNVGEASRKIGVTEQTYYRWRKEYGGMRLEQAKRLKAIEKENARLKKLVADLSLDNAILKEVAEGNF